MVASGALILMTLVNLLFGTSVKGFHDKIRARCLSWLINRKAAETGLDLTELNKGSTGSNREGKKQTTRAGSPFVLCSSTSVADWATRGRRAAEPWWGGSFAES